jgi:hypothetical protein
MVFMSARILITAAMLLGLSACSTERLGALAPACAGTKSVACTEDVALTLDDVPTLSLFDDLSYKQKTTSELLAGPVQHHIPAFGFVNEIQLEGTGRNARHTPCKLARRGD